LARLRAAFSARSVRRSVRLFSPVGVSCYEPHEVDQSGDLGMRNAYWDAQRRLLVFWVPKSACTVVAHWYARGLLGLGKVDGGPRAWLIKNGHNLRYPEALDVARQHQAHSIAFIRHPFDRLISAYLNKFVVFKDEPLDRFEKLELFAQRLYCKIKGLKPGKAAESYQGISFLELLHEIDRHISAAGSSESDLNGHINTQYPTMYRDAGYKPDEIFDIADLNQSLAILNQRYSCSYIPPARSNATTYSKWSGEYLADISSKVLARERIPVSKEGFASDATIKLARHAHAIDYQVFGFDNCPRWYRETGQTTPKPSGVLQAMDA
jgi:hypothetical protein